MQKVFWSYDVNARNQKIRNSVNIESLRKWIAESRGLGTMTEGWRFKTMRLPH